VTVSQVTDLDQYIKGGVPAGASATTRRFYSPIDDVSGALQAVIGSAQHSAVVAMYGFDDDTLAEMLAGYCQDPHMYVQISLDKSQAGGIHEKQILVKFFNDKEGTSVAIGTSERGAIMHRKMAIIDGVWLITGSTNWSTSGETLQDNELTVSYDPVECARARTVLDIEHDKMLKAMSAAASKGAAA
jgi:phosphatidylserine/phosphatidylglycerophosphate/cardiolipin synthase-like enzyme